jgi:hypothetical protein
VQYVIDRPNTTNQSSYVHFKGLDMEHSYSSFIPSKCMT